MDAYTVEINPAIKRLRIARIFGGRMWKGELKEGQARGDIEGTDDREGRGLYTFCECQTRGEGENGKWQSLDLEPQYASTFQCPHLTVFKKRVLRQSAEVCLNCSGTSIPEL